MAADTFVKPIVRTGTSDGLASPMQRALIFESTSGFTVTSVENEVIQGPDGATITGYYLVALANPVFEDITISEVSDPRVVLKANMGGQVIDLLTVDSAGPTLIIGNETNIAAINVNLPSGGELNLSVGGLESFVGIGADFTQIGVNSTVRFKADANGLGFFNATPIAKPSISGSRGGNAALADLLTKLALLGLITDGTSA